MATTVVNLKGRAREHGGACPEGVVYIGRAMHRGGWRLPGSAWANPYRIGRDGDREEVIARYREYVSERPELRAALPGLRGKVLGWLWVALPCIGKVLAERADAVRDEGSGA